MEPALHRILELQHLKLFHFAKLFQNFFKSPLTFFANML